MYSNNDNDNAFKHVSQKSYYTLYAIIRNNHECALPVTTSPEVEEFLSPDKFLADVKWQTRRRKSKNKKLHFYRQLFPVKFTWILHFTTMTRCR